jgi:Flp pilus assembly protein TadB
MSNQYLWDRLAGRDPTLRAADADRERVAERLRTSHAEGRIDMDEFQQRLERCYDAKTFGELGELVRDLPRQNELDARRSLGWSRPWRWRLALFAPILIALIVVSAATGHEHHVSWLWIPVVFLVWRMSWWRRRRSWAGTRRGPNDWI